MRVEKKKMRKCGTLKGMTEPVDRSPAESDQVLNAEVEAVVEAVGTEDTGTPPPAKIVVLTTGGTIACTTDPSGALVPTVSGAQLIAPVAARFDPSVLQVEVRELNRMDSSSMTLADIDEIVAAVDETFADPSVTGIVVTHGTDSMEESAVAVDTFLNDVRPVVFTGAQRAFDHPEADGPENLFESIIIASDNSARGIGALIVFSHAIIPARGALKWHTSDKLAFATNGPEEPTRPDPVAAVPLADINVEVIYAYPGANGDLLRAAIAGGAQGIVVEAMGSGNVSTGMSKAIVEALEADIPVVITSRVPRGEVFFAYGGAGGGATLGSKGVTSGTYFHAGQARILLAVALATGRHPATFF